MAERKPKINLPLIRRVLKHIKAKPLRLRMERVCIRKDEAHVYRDNGHDEYVRQFPDCGTKACFAGWTFLLTAKDTEAAIRKAQHLPGTVMKEAGELLGFDHQEQAQVFTGSSLGKATPKAQLTQLIRDINTVLAARGLRSRVS